MKSKQASILGKLRRQMAQPPDSPFQRPSTPQLLRQAPQTPVSFWHMGPRHAPGRSAPPSFRQVTQP